LVFLEVEVEVGAPASIYAALKSIALPHCGNWIGTPPRYCAPPSTPLKTLRKVVVVEP